MASKRWLLSRGGCQETCEYIAEPALVTDALTIEPFPFGKTFAVALVDDTDCATLPALLPVYSALTDHRIRVTKTVWPLRALQPSGPLLIEELGGYTATLEDDDYRNYCLELQDAGHEIAMHTASGGNNVRGRTLEAYEVFERAFAHPPYTNVMHGRNLENLYWGKDIFRNRVLHALAAAFEPQQFLGHDPASMYYWGDICRERTRYVRLLETRRLNTLAFDPATPFHDPRKPDVPWWFSATYGAGSEFYRLITAEGIAQLRQARGASIIHTYCVHFARRCDGGRFELAPRFQAVLDLLAASRDGWYVPVVELLDRIRAIRGIRIAVAQGVMTVTNRSDGRIPSLALHGPRIQYMVDEHGRDLTEGRNQYDQICIGDLDPGEAVHLRVPPATPDPHHCHQQEPSYFRLFLGTATRLAAQYVQGVELVPWAVGRVPRKLSPFRPSDRVLPS